VNSTGHLRETPRPARAESKRPGSPKNVKNGEKVAQKHAKNEQKVAQKQEKRKKFGPFFPQNHRYYPGNSWFLPYIAIATVLFALPQGNSAADFSR
jgi:hypothetical protein